MRRLSSLLALVLVAMPVVAQEAATDRKAELARELMELTGAGERGRPVVEEMISLLRAASPEAFREGFLADIDPGELEEMVVPTYAKHRTVEEMEAAIAFYRTPEGQAVIRKMPVIVRESMRAGQEHGMELAREVERKLETSEKDGESP